MECYCDPLYSDDFCPVWVVTWRTARKDHKCCECLEPIRPGQKYERIFSVYDGAVNAYKTCEFCAKEYKAILTRNPDLHWMKGNQDLACAVVWELRNV